MVNCCFLFVETSPLLHLITALLPASQKNRFHPHADIARAVAAADNTMTFALRMKDDFSCMIADRALIFGGTGYGVAAATA